MPLVLLSGFPKSGKTHRAEQLIADFNERIATSEDARTKRLKVVHVSDDELGISRHAYENAKDEKMARGGLSSAIKRTLDRDTIVVADAMNYIKGFRYQLYCEAKAVRTNSCVIHVGAPPDTCRARNEALLNISPTPASKSTTDKPSAYPPAVFDNLIMRYEEPNGMTRWDSPLFTVIDDDPQPPLAAIWTAMCPWTASAGAPGSGAASTGSSGAVKPNLATVLMPATDAEFLQHLDKATSAVLDAVTAWMKDQVEFGSGAVAGDVCIPDVEDVVRVPVEMPSGGMVSRAVLLRIKRQFISLNRGHRLGGREEMKRAFVDYLNASFSE